MWDRSLTSFFCMCIPSYLGTICWRDYSFPMEWSVNTIVKNSASHKSTDGWFYFRAFNFYSIVLTILMLIPHNLDYSSFVISFEIGKCEFYTFVVLSQDGFVFFWVLCTSVWILGRVYQFLPKWQLGFWWWSHWISKSICGLLSSCFQLKSMR